MPVSVAPQFGSFAYVGGSVTVQEWEDEPGFSTIVVPVPRSDRGRDGDGYLRPRQVRLSGVLGNESWASQDDLRTGLDAFRAAHRPGRRNLARDSDRYLRNAQVEHLRIRDEGLLWVRVEVGFVAADPYYYSSTGDSDTWNTPANGNTRSVNNGGSVTALPVFTITVNDGDAGDLTLTLENTTTGKSCTVTALPVNDGDELVIDTDQQTVKLEGVNVLNYFTGEFFTLDPGSNTLELTLSGVTLTSIGTAWVKRWL